MWSCGLKEGVIWLRTRVEWSSRIAVGDWQAQVLKVGEMEVTTAVKAQERMRMRQMLGGLTMVGDRALDKMAGWSLDAFGSWSFELGDLALTQERILARAFVCNISRSNNTQVRNHVGTTCGTDEQIMVLYISDAQRVHLVLRACTEVSNAGLICRCYLQLYPTNVGRKVVERPMPYTRSMQK
jgi:hypothetical protein